jgi:hypothetical protein
VRDGSVCRCFEEDTRVRRHNPSSQRVGSFSHSGPPRCSAQAAPSIAWTAEIPPAKTRSAILAHSADTPPRSRAGDGGRNSRNPPVFHVVQPVLHHLDRPHGTVIVAIVSSWKHDVIITQMNIDGSSMNVEMDPTPVIVVVGVRRPELSPRAKSWHPHRRDGPAESIRI